MADTEVADVNRKLALTVSMVLLIAGIALYWVWGLMFDTWYPFTRGNIGVYSIYIALIGFGLIGVLLFRKPASTGQ